VSELPAGLRWALWAWAALVGACVGSFLNVVVARVPAGQSIVRPGSRCPRCGTPIAWYDNVPVLAWLRLRGRCRACRAPISIRYPLVELAGAAIGVLVVVRNGPSPAALLELAFATLLVGLALIDLDTWLLPHALTWPLIALGVLTSALGAGPAPSLASSLWGAAVGFASFAALSIGAEKLLKKEALGFGDVWLLAGLGAFLGVAALLPVVLLASTQGAIVGLVLLWLGKGEPGPTSTSTSTPDPDDDWIPPKHAVPFGPFLVAGALEWLWLGDLLARAVPGLDIFRG
jgi:leader peptidase (prepilin peptidase)/N-methyltransferase